MNCLIDNRQIRVFISSTFQDMQDERNYLMNHTFPELRRIAAERDVTLTEIDLRWGITKEESETGKVVEICLREIDNSIPFFIGIVGNRYGWIPSVKDINSSSDMKDRYNWVYNDIYAGLSVTEMEMQYGVLRRNNKTNAFFYIKSDIDNNQADSPEKLNHFRKAIKENGRYPVSNYKNIQELSIAVKKDFINLLDDVFPLEESTPHEIEKKKQHACISQLQQCYVDRNEAIKIDEFLLDESNDLLTITGETGCGKSALLANWIENRKSDFSHHYLYYFTNGQSDINPKYILKFWINELCQLQEKPFMEFTETTEYVELKSICEGLISTSPTPIVLILDDATSFLYSDNWQYNTLDWLPSVHGGHKMIIANSITGYSFTEYRKGEQNISETSLTLSLFSQEITKSICTKYLELYGKKLTEEQLNKITEFKFSSNGRVLQTLLDELINYGQFETLNSFLDSFVGAWTYENFYERFLNHVEGKYPEGMIEKFLIIIAISRYGIKEHELKDLLGFNPIVWSQIFCSFAKHLSINNGFLLFASMNLYKAIMNKYEKKIPSYRLVLIKYLEDEFKNEQVQNRRNFLCDELCSQYFTQASIFEYEEDMAERLYTLISKPDVIWYLIMKRASKIVSVNGEGKQSYKYWTWLHNYNPDKYSLVTYTENNKFETTEYLYKSSDLVDTALHADDLVGAVIIASKAIKLYRECEDVSEEIKEYFTYTVSVLHIAAYQWNLKGLESELEKLSNHYETCLELPKEQAESESCILSYAEAMAEKDIEIKMEKFKYVISFLQSLKDTPYSDLAMLHYRIANICQQEDLQDEALSHIESSEENMNSLGDEYNDYNECFKAHLIGTKGLIYKNMGRLEDAYNTIYDAIIKYEDIEDMRIEHGDMRATINYVEEWAYQLEIIQEMIENNEK